MLCHRLAIALFVTLSAPVAAQTPDTAAAPPTTAPAPRTDTVRVTLQTALGPIVLELEAGRAPVTTANFLRYVDEKRLDGSSIYRSAKVQEGFGLIQGGLRNDPKKVLPDIAHEPTSKTGLKHEDGTISMARAAPGTASSDFFISVGAMPSMDADPSQPGDNQGFAAFGRVVEGMDVVRRILDAPTSPTEGEGPMRGQMLSPAVTIATARRTPASAPAPAGE
ncbi:peptidylprolyl isomerase [Allosphingosinicella indica]|uniref:peptidylprolyl isomerase n=1 Tax=Allosphingosinicella indica TaxID=941907 RepID=A0A1X7G1N3_9SPHN|nr:peptidylprolyl isomerase [Allosphingosinicella indica]SMF61793.1 peptidyl-prolyl cis-trans isomerase A (cyclophilin A) [Allosphingosinicella indica]